MGGIFTDADGADNAEVPLAFIAVTVNVYVSPGVSPVTAMVPDPAPDTVPVFPPGVAFAVYFVIADPLSNAGAANVTLAVVAPVAVAAETAGAPGAVDAPHTAYSVISPG